MNQKLLTMEEIYKALSTLTEEERSYLPVNNLEFFTSIEQIMALSYAYGRAFNALYKMIEVLKNPGKPSKQQIDNWYKK